MNEEQNHSRREDTNTRAQLRHERWLAKEAARAERRAVRASRPRRDWSFEVHAGEKVYTFNWRWNTAEPQQPVDAADQTAAPLAQAGPDAVETDR